MIDSEETYTSAARAALPHYGFGTGASLTLLSLSENGTYLVEERGRRAIIRVHRSGYHDRAAIESELSWMERVSADCGVSTPQLIPALDGQRVVTVFDGGHPRHVDAVSVIDGHTGEDAGCEVRLAELGRISAQLHRHAEQWHPPTGFTRFRWDFAHNLGAAARWGDWRNGPGVRRDDHALLERAVVVLADALDAYGMAPDRFGLIHADLRMSNIMVSPGGEITVIDFDDCGYGWLMSDLSSVVSWHEHDEEKTHRAVSDWLSGYLPHRALSEDDLSMIPAFVMMRRLMLTAWLGTHPDSPPARAVGTSYAQGTVELAGRFLTDPTWLRFSSRDLTPSALTA